MATNTVWTIIKILDWTKQYFAGKGIEDPRTNAELLLCEVLNYRRIDLYVHFEQPLQPAELAKYHEYVIRRGKQEPLAYILGHKEFLHYDFKVAPGVLVPRPETELLVENVAKACGFKGFTEPKPEASAESAPAPEAGIKSESAVVTAEEATPVILDVGCGSGIIILSLLAMLPKAKGTGLDISPAALEMAKTNSNYVAEQIKDETLPQRVTFVAGDATKGLPAERKFDIVVSNPPYIPTAVIGTLAKDVQQEPHLALDGGADGMDFYRKLLQAIPTVLQKGGLVALEIGIKEGKEVEALCQKAGLAVTAVCPDYAGIERMVFATEEGSKYEDFILGLKR